MPRARSLEYLIWDCTGPVGPGRARRGPAVRLVAERRLAVAAAVAVRGSQRGRSCPPPFRLRLRRESAQGACLGSERRSCPARVAAVADLVAIRRLQRRPLPPRDARVSTTMTASRRGDVVIENRSMASHTLPLTYMHSEICRARERTLPSNLQSNSVIIFLHATSYSGAAQVRNQNVATRR